MGSRNKKKDGRITINNRRWLVSMLSSTKKKRSNKASSSTSRRITRSQDLELKATRHLSCEELKAMRPLSSNDEAFHLSWMKIGEIVEIIRSSRTPTHEELKKWDEYAVSFYLKMRNIVGGKKPPFRSIALKAQKVHMVRRPFGNMSLEELLHMKLGFCRPRLFGPIKFGFYSSGTGPDCIPYHLYLLVKEAVDIMKRPRWHKNPNDLTDLKTVEKRIWFFCKYFHIHLPAGWKYVRANASTVVARYDPTRNPRYNLAGYTPISCIRGPNVVFEYEDETQLSRQDMVDVMSIIHSRNTSRISALSPLRISFYCKVCSCFGIPYHRLEDASEDDVCLMNVGRNGLVS